MRIQSVLVLISAGAIGTFTVYGAIDAQTGGWLGFSTSNSNVVSQIVSRGPASKAGLHQGDHLVALDGTRLANRWELLHLPPAKAGDTHVYQVERDSHVLDIHMTAERLPGRSVAAIGGAGTGLAFLVCGIFVYARARTRPAWLLVWLSILAGGSFSYPPLMGNFVLRQAMNFVVLLVGHIGSAVCLHFVLSLPPAHAITASRRNLAVLYAPAILLVTADLAAQFDASLRLPAALMGINVLVSSGYLLTALGVLGGTWWSSTRHQPLSDVRTLVLWALGIGILPNVIPQLVHAITPQIVFPRIELYPLTFIVVPFILAYAVLKQQQELVGSQTFKPMSREV